MVLTELILKQITYSNEVCYTLQISTHNVSHITSAPILYLYIYVFMYLYDLMYVYFCNVRSGI